MRIAQVSPLYESVPPAAYGGTERVVAYLTEELVRQGHEVTLFASGDSSTRARLIPVVPRALRLADSRDPIAPHMLMLERVRQMAGAFDLIHFHIDHLHFPLSRLLGWPQVTTLHGRLDLPELPPLYDEFDDMPVVSISRAQRAALPQARWAGTVLHGLPADLFHPAPGPGRYLAFLGRMSPEKRVDRAIEIARRLDLPLKIAAKVDPAERTYFVEEIAPLLDHPSIEYIGEVGDAGKQTFLGEAAAVLFPIDWAEPFGLVMIEAMACGTPVVAWRAGSVPEVLTDGVTGFIVDSIDEAVAATRRAVTLDRRACRAAFEARFTAARMAADYVDIYRHVIAQREPSRQARAEPRPAVESV